MSVAHEVDWQQETKRYDAPHPRLELCARLLRRHRERRLLDVGCSTATLKRHLPGDYEYYGCDVSDHARVALGKRFQQIDLNRTCDFSHFAGEGIDVIHIGGVLEYLQRPEELFRGLRALVERSAPVVLSIINFEAACYADAAKHHPGWIFKPRLEELRTMLKDEGWRVERQLPFVGKRRLRDSLFRLAATRLGIDHPWTRRRARQFILLARAA